MFAAFSPQTLTERPVARKVVLIASDGKRTYFDGVADAAHALQVSKSSVRKACRKASRTVQGWLKYRDCKDPAGAPDVQQPDPPYRSRPAAAAPQPSPSEGAAETVSTTLLPAADDPCVDVLWRVTASPIPGAEEEVTAAAAALICLICLIQQLTPLSTNAQIRLYCLELGEGLITTIRVDTGSMNCSQICAAAGDPSPFDNQNQKAALA